MHNNVPNVKKRKYNDKCSFTFFNSMVCDYVIFLKFRRGIKIDRKFQQITYVLLANKNIL